MNSIAINYFWVMRSELKFIYFKFLFYHFKFPKVNRLFLLTEIEFGFP